MEAQKRISKSFREQEAEAVKPFVSEKVAGEEITVKTPRESQILTAEGKPTTVFDETKKKVKQEESKKKAQIGE